MAAEFDSKGFAKLLAELSAAVPDERPDTTSIDAKSLRRLHELTKSGQAALARMVRWLDPIRHPEEFFDPASPEAAAEIVTGKLLRQPRQALASVIGERFWGSGVYALYYSGNHPAYKAIRGTDIPIYVGKAEPTMKGARAAEEHGTKLYERLSKHASSIKLAEQFATSDDRPPQVRRIALADFECRYLPLNFAYVGAVEANLLHHFSPVWNEVCPGFGKHGDSPDTRANTRSEWDTLHPGRKWATRAGNIVNPKTPAKIQSEILAHSRAVKARLGL